MPSEADVTTGYDVIKIASQRLNMASPVKVDEGPVRGQGEAGKKRGSDAKAADLPRKISIPSPTPLVPGSITRGAVALEPYRLVVYVLPLMAD